MTVHVFDTTDAADFGVECAVIIWNFGYLCANNLANERNIHDGRVWTYNTVGALAKVFPYLSKDQIRRRRDKREGAGVLVCGNYNKMAIDKTKWYAFADQETYVGRHASIDDSPIGKTAKSNWQNREPELAELPNANWQNCQSNTRYKPDINTDINPLNDPGVSGDKPTPKKSKYPDWFESLWSNFPPRAGSNDKRRALQAANARIKEGYTVDDLVAAVERYCRFSAATGKLNTEFVKQAASFFGPGGHIENEWRIPNAENQPAYRESIAERSYREAAEIQADAEAGAAGERPVGEDAAAVRPQMDHPSRAGQAR